MSIIFKGGGEREGGFVELSYFFVLRPLCRALSSIFHLAGTFRKRQKKNNKRQKKGKRERRKIVCCRIKNKEKF